MHCNGEIVKDTKKKLDIEQPSMLPFFFKGFAGILYEMFSKKCEVLLASIDFLLLRVINPLTTAQAPPPPRKPILDVPDKHLY